jgi:hypothetical protein
MRYIARGLTVLLTLAVMLSASVAQAMDIQKFDTLAVADQSDYVVVLIEGAQKLLTDQGQNDLAAKVHKLFTEIPQGDDMPVGMTEFESNVARVRLADLERVAKDSNATRLEVEHAMIVTLKKNGIALPKSFMHVGDSFKPKHPLKNQ